MFAKIRKLIADALDDSRFVIRIAEGNVVLAKGKVPKSFLRELRSFVKEEKLTVGTLRGKLRETYIRLVFSREIPEFLHQRIRNIWHIHEPQIRTDAR